MFGGECPALEAFMFVEDDLSRRLGGESNSGYGHCGFQDGVH
jgi:hypothetical protein